MLFRAEWRRLLKRRFIRYLVLAALVILVAIAGGMYFTNHKVGPAQIAEAQAAAERDYQEAVRYTAQEKTACETAKSSGTEDPNRFPPSCDQIQAPPREAFSADWHMPATFEFRKEFGGVLTAFAAILGMVAFVAGASFVGAEWSSGGMMNLLLWRPQRLKVLLTKLGALLVGFTGLTVLASIAWTAGFWLIASKRGTTTGMTSGAWQSIALSELRGLGLVLAIAAVGFAVASLGRHTAVALGGAIGVAIVGQFGVGLVLSMANVAFIERYLLPTYLIAWMNKSITLENWNACNNSFNGNCEPAKFDVTWQHSAVLFGAAVVLSVGFAMWAMRRRDVT
jgi:ABC-2 type transport system permease protein